LIILSLLAACERDPVPLSNNSSIRGSVFADSAGRELYGINIRLAGPYGVETMITDKKEFRFDGLGNGTYSVEYSRKGYGTVTQHGFQLFGGDELRAPGLALYQLPSITVIPRFISAYVTQATSPASPYKYIYVNLAVTNVDLSKLSVMFFMSTDRKVSWESFEFSCSSDRTGTTNSIPYIRASCILPFKSGSEVYIVGYPYNKKESASSASFDFYAGRPSFSTLVKNNPTNIVSFIIP
jgi:hypothetical protein